MLINQIKSNQIKSRITVIIDCWIIKNHTASRLQDAIMQSTKEVELADKQF